MSVTDLEDARRRKAHAQESQREVFFPSEQDLVRPESGSSIVATCRRVDSLYGKDTHVGLAAPPDGASAWCFTPQQARWLAEALASAADKLESGE